MTRYELAKLRTAAELILSPYATERQRLRGVWELSDLIMAARQEHEAEDAYVPINVEIIDVRHDDAA